MRTFRTHLLWGGVVFLVMVGTQMTGVSGQAKKSQGKGIDVETVAAYEKLGAVYGGWIDKEGNRGFEPGQKHAEDNLPAFQFRQLPTSKLPDVAVPFALDLNFGHVTPARVKQVARLNNLTTLSMPFKKVTDEGHKELRRAVLRQKSASFATARYNIKTCHYIPLLTSIAGLVVFLDRAFRMTLRRWSASSSSGGIWASR